MLYFLKLANKAINDVTTSADTLSNHSIYFLILNNKAINDVTTSADTPGNHIIYFTKTTK